MLTIDEKEARTNPIARRSLLAILKEDCMVDNLLSGDFAATDTPLTLGVEHKSFNDFVGSLSNNRLDEQMARLLETYDVPVLLIDEMPAPSPNGKLTVFGARRQVTFAWVMGSIAGWALRGIIPLMVRTPGTVGPTVAALYHVVAKEEHRAHFEPKRLLDNLRPMSLTERVLIQLPGVGPDRAGKLADRTPAELSALSVKEWQAALGPLTGMKAYRSWNGEA